MRGDSPSRDGQSAAGPSPPLAEAPRQHASASPRLRLRFSLRGLMFLAATFAAGCALAVHAPSAYGRIAALSILFFWIGYGCILAGDELFVRGGARNARASKILVGVGAPTLLMAVLSGTTSTLMALAHRFIARPHSSWSLSPDSPGVEGPPRRRPPAPIGPPSRERSRPRPSETLSPGELASRCDRAGGGVT